MMNGQKREMTKSEESMCITYWNLQRQAHTNPATREYVSYLGKLRRERGIPPAYLNGVGLEMQSRDAHE